MPQQPQQPEQPTDTWKPNASRLGYVCRVIEGMCVLWSSKPDTQKILCDAARSNLNNAWSVEHAFMPQGHEAICAQVFWNEVSSRYPGNGVYTIKAVFGETVNHENNARRVVLYVQPSNAPEQIQLNIESRNPR